ncbi:MAG: TIGR03619 family F420-dependent LLM class oxidoreductase [Actinomycetota bacterium]
MRIGLSGFPLGQMKATLDAPPFEVITRIARAADDLGFEFVAAQDHTVAPRAWAAEGAGETWFEPFSVLSTAAAVTSRVRLLTDVIVLPYRAPFMVAKTAASLDTLSSGRLILGVAAGYLEQEFGILHADFAARGAVTDESIEVIRACWTGEWVDFKGTHFEARDVSVSPRPATPPPIWVGGNSMRALRRAIQLGDGWTPFRGNPATIKAMLDDAFARWGKPDRFDVCVPLRGGIYNEDKETIDGDGVKRQLDALARAGVTYVKAGFRGPRLDDYLRGMERFARAVF